MPRKQSEVRMIKTSSIKWQLKKILIVITLVLSSVTLMNIIFFNFNIKGLETIGKKMITITLLDELKLNLNEINLNTYKTFFNKLTVDEFNAKTDPLVKRDDHIISVIEKDIKIHELKQDLMKYREARTNLTSMISNNETLQSEVQLGEFEEYTDKLMDGLDKSIEENKESISKYGKNLFKVTVLLLTSIIVFILISILISLKISMKIIKKVTNGVDNITKISTKMGECDFTEIDTYTNKQDEDEITLSVIHLSNAVLKIRELITSVSKSSNLISLSSSNLTKSSNLVLDKSITTNCSIQNITSTIQELTALIEEVGANIENITVSTDNMLKMANNSLLISNNILEEADNLNKTSIEKAQQSNILSLEKQKNVKLAISNSVVVDNISNMAKIIQRITDDTRMLSINASIEAAKSGEYGKGFSVVANEIKELAKASMEAANSISEDTIKIKDVVNELSTSSLDLIHFLDNEIASDYKLLVDTTNTYKENANVFKTMAGNISNNANMIKNNISDVNNAIATITGITEETSATMQDISTSVDDTTINITDALNSINNQEEMIYAQDKLIKEFKI